MTILKVFLTGLVIVSLCMADISGIVTDTGSTPITGAVVQLEKGGQTATSGADGRFTLVVSTDIYPGNAKLLPNGLSARISGDLITVTIAKRSAVAVAMFDLTGKALSTVSYTLDAGSHFISLPYRGTGMHLYMVKSGNREFVLKGNAIGGASTGGLAIALCSMPNSPVKQARSLAAINDVIAAVKDGYLNYRCVIGNFDTAGIVIKMAANAGTVIDTDGNAYQSVRIGNQVWTVDNLRVTKYNDGSDIPLDTSTATWSGAATPKYCFYKNAADADTIKRFGALYNWHVVNPANSAKIAPAGWHIPTAAEWDTLQNYLIAKGYNWDGTTTGNKIAKSLAAKTDWHQYSTAGTIGCDLTKNNSSGFSALPSGHRDAKGNFLSMSSSVYWWSASEHDTSTAYHCYLFYVLDNFYRNNYDKSCGFSVRLVSD